MEVLAIGPRRKGSTRRKGSASKNHRLTFGQGGVFATDQWEASYAVVQQ
jgi:hypothetical protein